MLNKNFLNLIQKYLQTSHQSCMICKSELPYKSSRSLTQSPKVIVIQTLNKDEISLHIVSMINLKQKVILVGASSSEDEIFILGISLPFQKRRETFQMLHKFRRHNVYPGFKEIDKDEIFQVQFVKVTGHPESKEDQQYFAIRIISKMNNMNKMHFLIQRPVLKQHQNQEPKYKLVVDIVNKDQPFVPDGQIYQTMLKNYQKRSVYQKQIDCFQVGLQIYQEKSEIYLFQNYQKTYGSLPIKKMQHHSIIIVNQKDVFDDTKQSSLVRDNFRQFLNKLELKGYMDYYEIYQKFNNNNTNVSVFYLNHKIISDDVHKIVNSIDRQMRHFVWLKIKQQIKILSFQNVNKAKLRLRPIFQEYFQTELIVKYKDFGENSFERQCFFIFRSQLQSIFSFTFLTYLNIKVNFVSKKKVQNTVFESQLKSLT